MQRVLIGSFLGAVIGAFLYFVVFRESGLSTTPDREIRALVFMIGLGATVGGLTGGFLTRSGWEMLAGGLAGAIVAGILGVVFMHHINGFVYSFFGLPIGAVAVFLYGSHHEWKRSVERAAIPPDRSGVWDRELDG
jgi:hypothetical protein